jgi:4-amino-4-deoxy-L-arabinose transferase-like glycosyltransferase
MRMFTERLGDWRVALTLAAGCVVALAAVSIVASHRWRIAAAGVAVAAALALPLAWAASAVLVPAHGTLPSADLYRLDPAMLASGDRRITGSFGKLADVAGLAAFLQRNRDGERFLLATTTTRYAAPLIIVTREPVMAMGGFHGLDGAVTPGELERRVGEREVRFVMLGDAAPPSRRLGADEALRALDEWVRAHGRRVPRDQWRSEDLARTVALYDLRPERGWR